MASDITLLWSAKGGSGTTVTTAAAAIHEPDDVTIVDLCGDIIDVMVTQWPRVGLSDWFNEPQFFDDLDALTVDLDTSTSLLPTRIPVDLERADGRRVDLLCRWMRQRDMIVLVDAGLGPPPDHVLRAVDRNLLVTRSSYLAIMKAVRCGITPDGIVLINDAGRTLDTQAIERAVGVPVVTEIDVHPSVARTVDAGILTGGHAHFRRSTVAITHRDPPATALRLWRADNPQRHSPDVDFGTHWTSPTVPGTWRVSWNTGSGDLYATTSNEDQVEVLGSFATEMDLRKSIGGWATHHGDHNGLDWIRNQAARNVSPAAPYLAGPSLA